MKYALYNGSLVPHKQALIPIEKKEVLFSFGVYESLKVKRGVPLFIDEHLGRFFDSARIMELIHPFTASDIAGGIHELIRVNKIDDATIRIQMYGGEVPFYYAFSSALPRYPERYYSEGIDVISYEGERFLPRAKSNCLLLNFMAQREADRASALEALLVNREGKVLEGSRSNLFALKDRTLVTAEDEVLHGVTRKHIIQCCGQNNIDVEYEPLRMEDILQGVYDGICISSTSMGAVPVRRFDGKSLAPQETRRETLRQTIALFNRFLTMQENDEIEKGLRKDDS